MRPWSGQEAEEAAEQILEALHDAVGELPTYAQRAATAEHRYRVEQAKAFLSASGSNKEAREAAAYLAMNPLDTGKVHPRLARDLAASQYRDQNVVIRTLQAELELCRTMIVSARTTDGVNR